MKSSRSLVLRLVLFIGVVSLMQSCTVEKRRYMNGYHIDWHHNKTAEASREEQKNESNLTKDVADEKTTNAIVLSETASSEKVEQEVFVDTVEDTLVAEEKVEPVNQRVPGERLVKAFKPQGRGLMAVMSMPGEAQATTMQDYNKVGVAFGIIAFGLAVLTILAAIITIFSTGWAALGWVAISVVLGFATLIFTIVAQTIFWSKHEGIPKFMILPLAISVLALYPIIRILIDRLFIK
jgi:hypothetical protein